MSYHNSCVENATYDFVKDLDRITGEVKLATPCDSKFCINNDNIIFMTVSLLGDDFCIWCGSYASKIDCVAVMVFVGVNGYHAHAQYIWTRDSSVLEGEEHPIIYSQLAGLYECILTTQTIKAKKEFHISCELHSLLAPCIYYAPDEL